MKFLKRVKENLLGKISWNYRVGFSKADSSKFVVLLNSFVDSDSLEWGLSHLGMGGVELKVGESFEFSNSQLKDQEFALLKSLPLTKIYREKNITPLHVFLTSYIIIKKNNGVELKIVCEGVRKV